MFSKIKKFIVIAIILILSIAIDFILCKSKITVDDELLLKGLMDIYNKNK